MGRLRVEGTNGRSGPRLGMSQEQAWMWVGERHEGYVGVRCGVLVGDRPGGVMSELWEHLEPQGAMSSIVMVGKTEQAEG